MLLFAMIKSIVKLFKVPVVVVVATRLSNESVLLRMTESTPKPLVYLTLQSLEPRAIICTVFG